MKVQNALNCMFHKLFRQNHSLNLYLYVGSTHSFIFMGYPYLVDVILLFYIDSMDKETNIDGVTNITIIPDDMLII